MTAAERHAIKVLIDRAKRAKLVADGIRAGHGARLHGRNLAPVRMNGSRRPYFPVAEDEQAIEAEQVELGITTRGNLLPSQRKAA